MRRPKFVLYILIFLLLLVIPVAVGVGTVHFSPLSILKMIGYRVGFKGIGPPEKNLEIIILFIRLPRVISALLVGAALSVSGAAMQGLFRNPLASPEILGVSAGGSLGAVISITTGLFTVNIYFLPAITVLGSLASCTLIYVISTYRGRTSLLFIVLAGMAISCFLSGVISAVLLFSKEYEISQFIFWTMGGLDGRRWEHVRMVLPFILIGILILLFFSRELNMFMLGEEGAHARGMNVEVKKRIILGLSAVITGVAVSISGMIGFVGLLVPHLLRLILGSDHRTLMPASALGGALFLIICDMVGRVILPPLEIRVGIITSTLGAPYLIFMLFYYQRRKTHVPID